MAEIAYAPFGKKGAPRRPIMRRVPPSPGSQLALFSTFSYHAFICDRKGETLANAIRDLNCGMALNHLLSGKFAAGAAWLAFQVMARNLGLRVNRLGLQEAPLRT